MMIGYVTIGAKDSEASGRFYDAVLDACGSERKFADGGWIGYGPKGKDEHSVYVCPPFDQKPATFGNGSESGASPGSARNTRRACGLAATKNASSSRYSAEGCSSGRSRSWRMKL